MRYPSEPQASACTTPSGVVGVRVDTFGHDGCRVSPHYDSLLAKAIVHQPTRPETLRGVQRCLGEFIIEPVKTTLPFLRKMIAHLDFLEAAIDTGFVERTF